MGGFSLPNFEQGVFGFENTPPEYNNPGGIQANQQIAYDYGALNAGGSGLAQFPTITAGINAFENSPTVQAVENGGSLSDFVNTWAPPSAGNNNNENYLTYLNNAMGLQGGNSAPSSGPSYGGGLTPGSTGTQTLNQLPNTLNSAAGAPTGTSSSWNPNPGLPTGLSKWFGNFSWGTVAAFILGIGIILAAVFMLKPTQQAAQVVTGAALRAA